MIIHSIGLKIIFNIFLLFAASVYTDSIEREAYLMIGRYSKKYLGYNEQIDKKMNIKAIIKLLITMFILYMIGGVCSLLILVGARLYVFKELRSYCLATYITFEKEDMIISLLPEKCNFIKF